MTGTGFYMSNHRKAGENGKNGLSIHVPWGNAILQYQEIKKEIDVAINHVLSAGKFILNSDVFAFEEEFASYCGVRYAVTVHSGSDAIALALIALNIGNGDEVVLPDNSCMSEPNAIMMSRAIPVPVDIEEQTYNMDPKQIEHSITRRTKAIHAVHAYGQPCDMATINRIAAEQNLPVIEDISLAPGARIDGKRVGRFGDIAVASFGHGKVLNAYGNGGGIVLTNSEDMAKKLRSLSNYGQQRIQNSQIDERYLPPNYQVWTRPGYNSLLDAIQAAVLRVKLRYLDQWLKRRREKAYLYDKLLSKLDIIIPHIRDNVTSTYRGYIIRVKERKRVLEQLLANGIEARTLYLPPIHLQPAMNKFSYQERDFPVTERVARELIVLPIYPELEDEKIGYVAKVLHTIFKNLGA
jgi:dTDP-4-amino-4,6-dideoxygalactose transaminase